MTKTGDGKQKNISSHGKKTDIFKLISDPQVSSLWWLVFDLPGQKVNKLNQRVLEAFQSVLDQIEKLYQEKKLDALVFRSGKKDQFIAGADLDMLGQVQSEQEGQALSEKGQALLNRLEDFPFPVIAAVQGACLGGGCEIALACQSILLSNDSKTKIGLPEALLGLIPGMGGCVRLPLKVGLATALEVILGGKVLLAKVAYRKGLAAALLPQEDFYGNVRFWVQKHKKDLQKKRVFERKPKLGGMGGIFGNFLEKTSFGRKMIFRKAKEGVLKRTKGKYPAPLVALDVVEKAQVYWRKPLSLSERTRALQLEAQGFGKVAASEVSRHLIELFFLTEEVKKQTGLTQKRKVPFSSISKVGVIGAGVMGSGMSQVFLEKNMQVRLMDLNFEAIEKGVGRITRGIWKKVKRRRLTKRAFQQKLNQLVPQVEYRGWKQLDLVMEAVVEDLKVKKELFSKLEKEVSPKTILATNTSSLSVTKMQEGLKHPERVVGLHFFNPVPKMPLVEVVRGKHTSEEVVAAAFDWARKIGKIPVSVQDAPGFLVNRLLMPYLNEACLLLQEGVPIVEMDRALERFGMPMGPMELIDEVGIDVAAKVAKIFHQAFGDRMKPSAIQEKIYQSGRLGKKNLKGFYQYKQVGKGKLIKVLAHEVYALLSIQTQAHRYREEDIVDRCVLVMVNEAARCLDEGVVEQAADVDLAMIMGTGFPPFRGGLLRYADQRVLETIVHRLKEFEQKFGLRFAPSEALKKFAKKSTFYSHSIKGGVFLKKTRVRTVEKTL